MSNDQLAGVTYRENVCHRGLCDEQATHRVVFTHPKAANTDPFGYCEEHAHEKVEHWQVEGIVHEGITEDTVTAWTYIDE